MQSLRWLLFVAAARPNQLQVRQVRHYKGNDAPADQSSLYQNSFSHILKNACNAAYRFIHEPRPLVTSGLLMGGPVGLNFYGWGAGHQLYNGCQTSWTLN